MCSDYVRDNVQLNFTFKLQKRFNSQWIMSGWFVYVVLHNKLLEYFGFD